MLITSRIASEIEVAGKSAVEDRRGKTVSPISDPSGAKAIINSAVRPIASGRVSRTGMKINFAKKRSPQ